MEGLTRMGLFDWLRRPQNPTKDWPTYGELPAFDPATRSFGLLKFGDCLEAARRVGRPEQCNYLKSPGCWCLEYVSRGYHLSFTADRLVDAFIEIGYGGEFALKPNAPKAQPLLSSGERLTANTQQADIIRWFGEPSPEDNEDYEEDGTLLDYPHPTVAMEFEFNTDGKLAYWHIFEPTRPR